MCELGAMWTWTLYLIIPSSISAFVIFFIIIKILRSIYRDGESMILQSLIFSILLNYMTTFFYVAYYIDASGQNGEAVGFMAPSIGKAATIGGFVGALLGAYVLSRLDKKR